MNDRIYKIFVSSTYLDLKDYRNAVIQAILRMQNLPVGMEMFNASSDTQWKIITDTIDECDYYVLILGKRYGSVMKENPDKGMSYTEREFRYALSKRIPCLGFLIDDEALVKVGNIETDPEKMKRLNEFREFVKDKGTINHWKNADELAAKVRSSLEAEIERHPRSGWIRNKRGSFRRTEGKEYLGSRFLNEHVFIDVSNWSSAPNENGYYTYSQQVQTFNTAAVFTISLSISNPQEIAEPSSLEVAAYNLLSVVTITDKNGQDYGYGDTLTCYAKNKPTTSFYINVSGVGA